MRIQAVLTIGEVQQSVGDGIVFQLGDKEVKEVFASLEARSDASRLPARGREYSLTIGPHTQEVAPDDSALNDSAAGVQAVVEGSGIVGEAAPRAIGDPKSGVVGHSRRGR